jgi:hypothetical protein
MFGTVNVLLIRKKRPYYKVTKKNLNYQLKKFNWKYQKNKSHFGAIGALRSALVYIDSNENR